MRRKTRTKVKKGLIISGIIVGIILIIIGIILLIKLNQKPDISYDDILVGKNYFKQITIDLNTKEVKRDNIETSLKEEFDISEEQENLAFSSEEEMKKFLSDSVFDVSTDKQIFTIKNPFQTKNIIVKAEEIHEKVEGEEIIKVADKLYILSFYSEKLTKAMYNYYKDKQYIEKIFYDDIFIDEPINDISQTMYGETEVNLNNYHSLGATIMGLDNYHKIINENGNPSNIVIATIGYGVDYQNEFFNERIDDKFYNFILNNKDISETIPQGSRIAEVLVDSTTKNVKIMPLVTVTEEGYTSTSSIIKALSYGTYNSDVICYEQINSQNEAIDIALENCFRENTPVCSVSANNKENYPANHGMTIATSSIDRDINIAEYSGRGEYIDFTAPSTDIEEIFNKGSSVSRWSGPEYSNAQIVASIALIKTYIKDATILNIYNFLRNFSVDIGEDGKDELYGYGCPTFKNLTISDIDKKAPEFKEITYENENWEVLKQVKIVAEDNIRMNAWAITKNENGPEENEWKILEAVTPNLDVTTEITENGKYYIWIRDIAGNMATKDIQIDKVDNTPPQIAYTINKDTLASGYVTINVTAEDNQSGLYDSPFSWDQRTWSQENSVRTVKENGRYKVYAEDNLGNVGELEILVDCFPQEGRYDLEEGNIITSMHVSADWTGNTNNNVEITLNKDLDIVAWQITNFGYAPSEFIAVEPEYIEDNNQNSDSNTGNISLPNNVVLNDTENTSSENLTNTTEIEETDRPEENQEQQIKRPRTEPIVLKTSLDINTTYYFWIKDSNGNISHQVLRIFKAEI
jgi:hypothetical protein